MCEQQDRVIAELLGVGLSVIHHDHSTYPPTIPKKPKPYSTDDRAAMDAIKALA